MSAQSLMDRAKSLVSTKTGLAALAIVPLAASATQASVVLNLTNSFVQSMAQPSGGGSNFVYPSGDSSFNGSSLTNGVHVVGSFSIDGSHYLNQGNDNEIVLQGTTNGQVNAGDVASAFYDLKATMTAGQVSFDFVDVFADPGLFDFHSVNTALTNGQSASGTATTNPAASSAFLTNGNWEVDLGFQWQGFSSTDTLTLTLPGTLPPAASVDLTINSVPEPATASILMLPAMALLHRRRRSS